MFKKLITLLLSIAGIILFVWMVPVVPVHGEVNYRSPELPQGIIESDTLDLLTLNVAHGRGTALNQILVSKDRHRKNLGDIASILIASGADIVALQEADGPSLWSGQFDHVAALSRTTDYKAFVHGYHADSWLFTYGAALLSRFPMTGTESRRFQPSWPTATKGYVRGEVKWRNGDDESGARTITLVSVHLDFSRKQVREAQIAELVDDLDGLRTPLVIMGDFNAGWSVAESPVRMLARGLDLHVFSPTTGALGTYKDTERLDWILISHELVFVDYTVLPNIVSDHLAVAARIGWKLED